MVALLARNRLLPPWMVQRRLVSRLFGGRLRSRATIFWAIILWLVLFQGYQTFRKPHDLLGHRELSAGTDGHTSVGLDADSEVTGGFEAGLEKGQDLVDLEEEGSSSSNEEEGSQGDGGFFRPGQPWFDTDGNLIQAHGGGILYVPEQTKWFWYGENKDGDTFKAGGSLARVDFIGVSCYTSRDLLTWDNVGLALKADFASPARDLHPSRVVERPKVLFNERTQKYVMWLHVDDQSYQLAALGVALSDHPEGPFKYLGRQRPHNSESRDFTVFKDADGVAYVAYSSEGNKVMHVGRLSNDFLTVDGPMKRVLVGEGREAPAIFTHRERFYMVTSGSTGWRPNAAMVYEARAPMGPWITGGDPCTGGNDPLFLSTTFQSQGTFILPLPGVPDMYIFMADRWREDDLRNSRYVWLPLKVSRRPAAERGEETLVRIEWHDKWKLPENWNRTTHSSS